LKQPPPSPSLQSWGQPQTKHSYLTTKVLLVELGAHLAKGLISKEGLAFNVHKIVTFIIDLGLSLHVHFLVSIIAYFQISKV
jgi:hypothetical protein